LKNGFGSRKNTKSIGGELMNELITTSQNDHGEIILSGRELHEFLEVKTRYNDWFERMSDYGFESGTDFIAITQKRVTAQGNSIQQTDHHIKIDMAKEIAMIQRTEKGKQARQYFLQLEKMWNSPEMVMKRALEYADRQVKKLEEQIQIDKPKVFFAEALESSKDSILINELAKILKKNGIDIGEKRLFDWMRENGYLIKQKGESYNLPTQKSMDLGLMEIKKGFRGSTSEGIKTTRTTKITAKGQIYFVNKFIKEGEATA
jgi:anti-repressor protein